MGSRGGAGPEGATASPLARLGLALGPLAFALLWFAPGVPLDDAQREVAAVTALTATWWITGSVPIGAASLLPAALFPLLGVLPGTRVAPLYMNDLLFLFLGAFVVSMGLERWNLHKRFALWVIAHVGTRPPRLVLGFMLASAFLSAWMNNTAVTLLMLPIGVAVIWSVSGKGTTSDPFATALLLGMAYSSSLGGVATPVGTAPNQVFLGQLATLFPGAPQIPFARWMIAWVPLVVLFVPVGWLLLTRVLQRVPTSGTRGADVIASERAALGPLSTAEKRMAAIFVATAVLWVTRADLQLGSVRIPGWSNLVGLPDRYVTDATVATFMAVLTFLVPAQRGTPLMDWETARRLPWEVLLLIGGGFAIAGGFEESGLGGALGDLLGPHLAGTSSWLLVLLVVAFVAALTEVTSNTATTAVLLPVLGRAAADAGVSPLLTMLPATIAASAAFMLPVATPPNAVVFSTGLVRASTMARVGLWFNVAVVLLITLVFQLWVRRVLGIETHPPAWAGG